MRGQRDNRLTLHRLARARGAPLALANPLRGLETIHHRHLAIHQHQIVSLAIKRFEGLLSVVDDRYVAAELQQRGLGHLLIDQIVLDHQHAGVWIVGQPLLEFLVLDGSGDSLWLLFVEQPTQTIPQRFFKNGLIELRLELRPQRFFVQGVLKNHDREQHQQGIAQLGVGADRQGQIRPADFRHLLVQQGDAIRIAGRAGGSQLPQSRLAVGGGIRAQAGGQQLIADQFAAGLMVVHHQHPDFRQLRAVLFGFRGRGFRPLQPQDKPEGRTSPFHAVDRDDPAHQFHQLPGDGQAQAGSAVLAGHRAVGLIEGAKNALLFGQRNADAGIAHLELQTVTVRPRFQKDQPQHHFALLGEFDGVAQQIAQNLSQAPRIAPRPKRRRRRGADQFQALALRALGEQDHHVLDQGAQRKFDFLQFQLARLDLGKIQHVVDDSEQAVPGLLDDLGEPLLLGAQLGSQQQIGHPQHAVHGRADFMTHVGQKLRFGLTDRLGPFLGLAEFLHQRLQFGVGERQVVSACGHFPLQTGVVGGQFSVALLDLRQHRVEALHQRSQFVGGGAGHANRVILGVGDAAHDGPQTQDRLGNHPLQPRGQQRRQDQRTQQQPAEDPIITLQAAAQVAQIRVDFDVTERLAIVRDRRFDGQRPRPDAEHLMLPDRGLRGFRPLLPVVLVQFVIPLADAIALGVGEAGRSVLRQGLFLKVVDHGVRHVRLGFQHLQILLHGLQIVKQQRRGGIGADHGGQREQLRLRDLALRMRFVDDQSQADGQQHQGVGQQHDHHQLIFYRQLVECDHEGPLPP